MAISCTDQREMKLQIAENYGNNEDYEKAINVLDEILESDPYYVKALTYKASYLFSQPNSKNKEALKLVNQAIELEPDCWGCYQLRGWINEGEEAIADFTKAIEIKRVAELYYSRAQARNVQKDYLGAIQDFDSSMVVKPEIIYETRVLTEKAMCLMTLKQYKNAKMLIDSAMTISDEDEFAYYVRSFYHFKVTHDTLNAYQDYVKSKELGLDSSLKFFIELDTNQNLRNLDYPKP